MDQYQSQEKLFAKLQGLFVHTDSPESKAPRDLSIRISSDFHMDQWLPNLSEVLVYIGICP